MLQSQEDIAEMHNSNRLKEKEQSEIMGRKGIKPNSHGKLLAKGSKNTTILTSQWLFPKNAKFLFDSSSSTFSKWK